MFFVDAKLILSDDFTAKVLMFWKPVEAGGLKIKRNNITNAK